MGKVLEKGGGEVLTQTHFLMSTYVLFLACQNDYEVQDHVLQKGGSEIAYIIYVINLNT